MRYLRHRLHEIVFAENFEFTELQLAVLSLLWGGWLAMPFWNQFSISGSFRYMAVLAPDWAWGGILLLNGALKLVALVYDKYTWRRLSLLLSVMYWFTVLVLIVLANPRGTSSIIYLAIAVTALWAFVRIRANQVSSG